MATAVATVRSVTDYLEDDGLPAQFSICMVSDDFLPAATGVGVHLNLIAPELVRRGCEVAVITSRRKGEPEVEQWRGVTIHRTYSVKVYGFYQALPSLAAVRRILERCRPDLVHHHYAGLMMLRVCRLAEVLGLPQVSTYHFSADVLTQQFPLRLFRSLIRSQMVSCNNRFDLVIAPSQKLADQLAAAGVRTPIRYISNPVVFDDIGSFVPAQRPPGLTVLYAGRLGPEKNVSFLLQGFAKLLMQVPECVLWIAGGGPEEGALRGLSAQLGIRDRVTFLGHLDRPTLACCYAACDVFVLPSLLETQGMVAMEAMWFAKPIIVTSAIVSAHELVEDGVSGYIVGPDSPAELASRLAILAADSDRRQAMGRAGRERARAFGLEGVVDSLLTAYSLVMEGRALGKRAL
ncbi:MAG TPA: glycosyltransferase [Accumulibacter sp.]|uniref:glycosyltransferase n=1 Tax=Accumulibacter sp. TaxID=2053492 RepID=UPI0025D17DDA|nr:glycosyltransferase [Accumulibacter sp.]MCM8600540.1 glycosyltransferase [Accumulibacter sp.]HNC51723.1 glycosyltransferase [Accumulibacter sp.]